MQLAGTHLEGWTDPLFRDSGGKDNNGDFLLTVYCKNDDSELRTARWHSGSLSAHTWRARKSRFSGTPAGATEMVTSS